jgi:hypothetical protein
MVTPEIHPSAWLQRAIMEALRAHPAGLRPVQVVAKTGYRSTSGSVISTVGTLRRRGAPIESRREGLGRRYVLGPV